jgi:hypothetical protein
MFITTTVTTKFDGFKFEMTLCHNTPCTGEAL